MPKSSSVTEPDVPSPCQNICKVRGQICTGCGRTLAEIEAWPTASNPVRGQILANARQRLSQSVR